jgi:hypothetical protein
MRIYLAHSSNFNFSEKLYSPIKESELSKDHEILFPQEGPVEEITRNMIEEADALLADVSQPSLGVGIEMGWADSFHVPVIAMNEKGSAPSFSIDNVVSERFEYENPEDMIEKITVALAKLRS